MQGKEIERQKKDFVPSVTEVNQINFCKTHKVKQKDDEQNLKTKIVFFKYVSKDRNGKLNFLGKFYIKRRNANFTLNKFFKPIEKC